MSRLQDFITDNNPTAVFHVDRKIGIPEYVKSAAVITATDVEGLSSAAFADRARRKFPIFSKEATWLSAAYFFGNKMEDSETEQSIRKAADFFDITSDVAAVELLFSNLEKKASTEERKFALSVDFGGVFGSEGVSNFYPLNNYGEVLGSAEGIMKDASSGALPIEFMRAASLELVKAAAAHGVVVSELADKLIELGTQRMPDFEIAERGIEYRKQAGLTEEQLQDYRDVLEGAKAGFNKLASDDVDAALADTDNWVELWCSLDREHGIKYANIPNPYSSFYRGMTFDELEKMASHFVVIDDVLVPSHELAQLPEKAIEQAFSAEDAEVVKRAQVTFHKFRGNTKEALKEASAVIHELDADSRKELLSLMLAQN